MAVEIPKYSLAEIERRWLVDLSRVGSLDPFALRTIDDLYIEGTRLRLRRMASSESTAYKLCKKYGKTTLLSERITNLYLTKDEYLVLCRLPGKKVRKRRYAIAGGSLDIYEEPKIELGVFEIEFADEAQAHSYRPPEFTVREITGDDAYAGYALAALALKATF